MAAVSSYPGRIAVCLRYDEALAHRVIAAADVMLVPSRFEPCGLTQLYALRYGTVPLVRRVGGLADTVVDATPQTIQAGTATGFMMGTATPSSLLQGMAQNFSWHVAATHYLALYEETLKGGPGKSPLAG